MSEPKIKLKVLEIPYEDFCSWYFDKNTIETTIENLIASGYEDVEEIANNVGYMPLSLIINQEIIDKHDVFEGVELNGELIGIKYKVKLLNNPKETKED